MNSLLNPEQVLHCQRWEQLQNEAELYRRHRQLSEDSRSHRRSKSGLSRFRRS